MLTDHFIDCFLELCLVLEDSVDNLKCVLSKLSFQTDFDVRARDNVKETLDQIIVFAEVLAGVEFFVKYAIVVEGQLIYQLYQLQLHFAYLLTLAKCCCLLSSRGAEPSTQHIYSVQLLDKERLLGGVLRLQEGCEARVKGQTHQRGLLVVQVERDVDCARPACKVLDLLIVRN